MIVEKIHKRAQIRVLPADDEQRKEFVSKDAKAEVALVAYTAIKDEVLNPGDLIMVDIRILIDTSGDKA